MSEQKIESKYIDKDPPMGTEQQLEKKNNDYLAYLKEKLNFILGTYGRRLTSANGEINELVRTAEETTSRLSDAEGDISAISQRADNIEISVAGKVGANEVISAINASPEQITISANRINLVGTTIVNGKLVSTYTKTFNHSDYSQSDVSIISSLITNRNWTASDLDKYDINMDGELTISDLVKVRNMVLNGTDETATIKCEIDPSKSSYPVAIYVNNASEPKTYLNGTQMVSQAGTFKHLKADDFSGSDGSFSLGRYGLYFYDSNGDVIANYPASGVELVVEQGTTQDGWTYRRWNSGVYECWIRKEYSGPINMQWGSNGIYYSAVTGPTYPVSFTEVPFEQATAHGGDGWFWLGGVGRPQQGRAGDYILLRPTQVTSSSKFYVDFYVRGTV